MSPLDYIGNNAKAKIKLNQHRTIQSEASRQAKDTKTYDEIKHASKYRRAKVPQTGVSERKPENAKGKDMKTQFSKPRFPFRSNKVHSFMPGPP